MNYYNECDPGAAACLRALPADATLAGWATPTVGDSGKVKPLHDAPQPALAYQAALTGTIPSPSPAETGKPDTSRPKLNPFFSAWLMGFPVAWTLCMSRALATRSRKARSKVASGCSGASGTRSSRKSRPSSSKPSCE